MTGRLLQFQTVMGDNLNGMITSTRETGTCSDNSEDLKKVGKRKTAEEVY